MGVKSREELKSPAEAKEEVSLTEEDKKIVEDQREKIKKTVKGEDDRLLYIVGPCSAWPYEPVLDFAKFLSEEMEQYNGDVNTVMRTYMQKPRTKVGWKGPLFQPDGPFTKGDGNKGINYARNLERSVIRTGLPVADEALYPSSYEYFSDLLSYTAIGARSSENQEHRIFASSLDIPVGIKNPTSGCLKKGVEAIVAAQSEHSDLGIETTGNSLSHLIIRGGVNGPNYYEENIEYAVSKLNEEGYENVGIIVDTSHGNVKDGNSIDPKNQLNVMEKVLEIREKNMSVRERLRGFMQEAYIEEGKQKPRDFSEIDKNRGLSVTDPCLSKEGVREAYRLLGHSE